jgi:ubiquinone/menaquinone biosynthesis C-methylase UbiE
MVHRWAVASCLVLASTAVTADEDDRIAGALRLQPGMTVADVGAGSGRFTVGLARKVGPSGRVFATEVETRHLEAIRARVAEEGLSNVTAVLGDQASTGLAAGCCDRVLLRLVYHHFSQPDAMRASLWSALRPGGLIAIVDVPPQKDWRPLPEVPNRQGHGVDDDVVVREMRAAGFQLLAREDDWPGEPDYALVFAKPAPTASRPR